MNDYFKQRIDETRQAYLDALEHLKKGVPNNSELKGKEYKINATTIALESGKSRNPLYHNHKDILDMINDVVLEDKKEEKKVKDLEDQNKKLISVNATLLFNKNLEKI